MFYHFSQKKSGMYYSYLRISGSSDIISSENRYGGLLTKAENDLQRLNTVSGSEKKQHSNKKQTSFTQQCVWVCYS